MISELEKLIRLITLWHLEDVAKDQCRMHRKSLKIIDGEHLLDSELLTEEQIRLDDMDFAKVL